MNEKILVVDDEKEIADLVEVYLKNENYNVLKCYTPESAIHYIKNETIDLAILDVMVGSISGFEILHDIRESGHTYPVIMLTAKIDDQDKIKGLTLGADDYITKPFNPLELVARVKSAIRRYTKYNKSEQFSEDEIVIDGLSINESTHKCYLYDNEIDFTPIEFDIVLYLAKNLNHVVSSEELFEAVWKEKYYDSNNTVMVHIRRIREKLNDTSKKPKFIKTVWGVGYKIEHIRNK